MKVSSVSLDALGVARQLDQAVRGGGRVLVSIEVDPFTKVWTVELSKVERVRVYVSKKGVSDGNV